MKFYTIVCIILYVVKSNTRKVIPHREECSSDNIREEELIEHEKECDRNNLISVAHDELEEPWWTDIGNIVGWILYKSKYWSNTKNVYLFDHIYEYCSDDEIIKKTHKNKLERIECLTLWLIHAESAMERKKECENIYEVDRDWEEKNSKSKRKESAGCPERIISYEEYWKHEINTDSYEHTKSRLIELTQAHEIVGHPDGDGTKNEKINIEICHWERCSKRIEHKEE